MASKNSDRNMLFGILALQMDFVSRDHLVAAMSAWVMAKEKTIGQILVEQGKLTRERLHLLDALVQEHMKSHGDDAEKSLAAVGSPRHVQEELKNIADPDIQASLGHVGGHAPVHHDPYVTLDSPGPSLSSSSMSRFRILRPFARGGLGEVLVAQDEELHREVALKQIQDRHADDQESRVRFVMEAEITGGLEHPGIVPVYGLGKYADGRPYYAMRFIRGDSLKEAIERFHKAEGPKRDAGERALALRQLLTRFIDVCQAIAYAHSRGVVHRDIKPANIMLGKYGETLVVDWGLAKSVDTPERAHAPGEGALTLSTSGSATPTMMGSALGTPQYMSPEQAAGQLDKLGPASDVYSLGATLYSLLTGGVPIPDADVGIVLRRVQRGEIRKPREAKADVPLALEAVCLRAMAVKPEDRYPTARQLADDIEHWLADEPVSAFKEPFKARTWRWLRRHRTIAFSAAAAVLVAVVALALATVLLTAANEREVHAKQDALAQKERAEKNFQLARQAVDRYHTEVSESILLKEPGFEPLRKNLLQAAREFYDEFVRERSDDPSVKGELGRAYFRLGLITADIESEPQAIAFLQRAIDIFQADEKSYQVELGRCWHHLGRLYRLTDQYAKSEESYGKALAIWQTMTHSPQPPLPELARSELGLGNVLQVERNLDGSRDAYRKALATWDELGKQHPDVPEYRRDQAVTHNNLGMVDAALPGKIGEALEEFGLAIALLEKASQKYPNVTQLQDDLARSFFNRGDVYLQQNQLPNALDGYQSAAKLWQQLAASHPSVLIFHTRLAEAYAGEANSLILQGKLEPATDASRKALAISTALAETNAAVPKYRGDLGKRHYQLGNTLRAAGQLTDAANAYREALKIQQKLAGDIPDSPQYQADAARTYNSLGLTQLDENQPDAAEAAFNQALVTWTKLESRYPQTSEFALGIAATCDNLRSATRGNHAIALESIDRVIATLGSLGSDLANNGPRRQALCSAYWARAEGRAARGLFDDALADWGNAQQLAKPSDVAWVRLYRAVTLARAGQSDQASREAHELAEKAGKAPAAPEALFQLARIYAIVAGSEAKKGGEVMLAQADVDANRAQQLLAEAADLGYFQQFERRSRIAEDADWQFLRSRDSFQALLKKQGGKQP